MSEAKVERRHREAAALALKAGTQFGASELEWIECGGGSVDPSWLRVAQALATSEASAQGEAGRDWVPVAEWPEDAGCVAIGYDVFYGRIGEVERRPGSTRWVFVDSQKDDCDVVKVQRLPPPPKAEPK